MLTIARFLRALSLAVTFVVLLPSTGQAQRPALTKNVDERGLVPYQSSAETNCVNPGACGITTFKPVPAGFRLVVTHVSCSYNPYTGLIRNPNYVYLTDSTFLDSIFVPVAPVASGTLMVGSSPVTFYAEPGTHPVVVVANTAIDYVGATIVGYLVAIN